jgi:hypothetical protein
MPSRKRFGKKMKVKKRMKGGNITEASYNREHANNTNDQLTTPLLGTVGSYDDALPSSGLDASKPIEMSKKGGSSYTSFSDDVFLSAASGIGLVGVAWFGISRSLVRHKYSEALSYTILASGILISLFLVLFNGIRDLKPSSGMIGAFKNILILAKYMLVSCVPAFLILVQLGVLIYIMYSHADYIFSSENIPQMFNVFNAVSIVMVLAQCWVWKDKVKSIMGKVVSTSNPMVLPGFILASILSGIAISQLYVILEYLRTDC